MRKLFYICSIFSILTLSACSNTSTNNTSSSSDEVTEESEIEETTEDTSSETFTIGFIPAERAEEITPNAEALADFLSEEMQMEIEIVVPTEYEPLIEGLRFENLDAAYMDSGPAYLATQKTDSEVVLAELKDGNPFYYGEVYVRAEDEEISEISDALGKNIAFTSWTGSSGFIFPIGTLVKDGYITPEGDDFVALEKAISDSFNSYIVAGGYEQALTLLVEGKVDVAAGAHDAAEVYLDEADQDKIKSIQRLGKVPSHPIVIGSHVDETTKEKFIEAMLKVNEPENNYIIQDLYGVEGLIETNTEEHLGDFGPAFESLTGVHEKVFNKHKDS